MARRTHWDKDDVVANRRYYVQILVDEVVVGEQGNALTDGAGSCTREAFAAGEFHDVITKRFGPTALAEMLAAVERAGELPAFATEHLLMLVADVFAELGIPWQASPVDTRESEISYAEDARARETRHRWHDGERNVELVTVVWRDESTNKEHVARIDGFPHGAALELAGDFSLSRYRVIGTGRPADELEQAWLRVCERTMRAHLRWHEHPAIPRDWTTTATPTGFVREVQLMGTHLMGALSVIAGDGTDWLVRGFPRLDADAHAALWMVGPIPPAPRRECALTFTTKTGVGPPLAAAHVAALVVGDLAWTRVLDETRPILARTCYGPVMPSKDGQPQAMGSMLQTTGSTDEVGREHAVVHSCGDRILRFTEFCSPRLPSSWNLALQSTRGELAVLAHGIDGHEAELHVLARADVPLEAIIAALSGAIRDAGWSIVHERWLPALPPPPHTNAKRGRMSVAMTAAEAAQFAELVRSIADKLRAGFVYRWSYREEWDECVVRDGKLVLSYGSHDVGEQPIETAELADDDTLAQHLVWRHGAAATAIASAAARAIRALEEAATYVRPGSKTEHGSQG